MRFFPNNNIADSLFFSSHKRKNGSLRQTLHPFKQTTGKESISRFPPTCAASTRNPKLALDFVLDDAWVFLCGDLAVVRPCRSRSCRNVFFFARCGYCPGRFFLKEFISSTLDIRTFRAILSQTEITVMTESEKKLAFVSFCIEGKRLEPLLSVSSFIRLPIYPCRILRRCVRR